MSYVLCLDCGATNVRAMVVNSQGTIVGKAAQPNATVSGEESHDYHVWDAEKIMRQLEECSCEALKNLDAAQVKAVTVTTFGVDGTLVDAEGNMLYPVISWKCPRTAEVLKKIDRYISKDRLNAVSGVGNFAFNTINKLVWLKENRPELLKKAHAWLFISNLLIYRMTGVMATDRTMAGTSQLTDLRTGEFSDEILNALGISSDLFPPMANAGSVIGELTAEAAKRLGLPAGGVPVVSTGHDTQFAVFGSGAEKNQPVLSSGTWEILMVRTEKADLSPEDFADGATAELDASADLRNPGLQWIASGIVEWVKSTCYQGESYDTMVAEAAMIPPGCDGVKLVPNFLPTDSIPGSIEGLVLGRTRGHIYRATLEALTFRLHDRLKRLESVSGFRAENLLLVGGGARNKLWTQMRADVLGIPVLVSKVSESTVLGAAMYAFSGCGAYSSPEEARKAFCIEYETYMPGDAREAYTQKI